jgi:hypothetical protein
MSTLNNPTLDERYDDLFVLQHSSRRAGMSTNAYAVLSDEGAVYIDAAVESLLPLIRQVADDGYEPAALLLTHRHVASDGDILETFKQEFDVPIFLHPKDAQHSQAASGIDFRDPTESDLLAAFDIDVQLFSGHTEGHVLIRWHRHGGVLFTGDAAMGPTVQQDENGTERYVRPPFSFSVDDEAIRRGWTDFDVGQLSGVAPYHGMVYLDRSDSIHELMRPLQRSEPTRR